MRNATLRACHGCEAMPAPLLSPPLLWASLNASMAERRVHTLLLKGSHVYLISRGIHVYLTLCGWFLSWKLASTSAESMTFQMRTILVSTLDMGTVDAR